MFRSLKGSRFGVSSSSGPLAVYPLFWTGEGAVDYAWAGDAMANGTVIVADGLNEQQLALENNGDLRVLFLEGLVLDRGHQNRGLNASVMVPGRAKLKLPVSCVEKGRSTGESKVFGCSETFVPPTVRSTLKSGVSASLSTGKGHHTNRDTVWASVSRTLDASDTMSGTQSVLEVTSTHRGDLRVISSKLPYVQGATGLAVALNGRLIGAEVFDKADTCRRLWTGLVDSYAVGALTEDDAGVPPPKGSDLEALLAAIADANWQQQPVELGEGQDYRASFGGYVASALVCKKVVVHASVIMAA